MVNVLAQFQTGSQRSPLVVVFHGRVGRARRKLPYFSGSFLCEHVAGTILFVADPSLERNASLFAAWYHGDDDRNVPEELVEFFRYLIAEWKHPGQNYP